MAAKRAYRDAFLKSAREAVSWNRIDYPAIDAAHTERRQFRNVAEVLVPSSVYFACPDLDSEQVAYERAHIVPAARFRGRVHGFESVRQCWEELSKKGISDREISTTIIQPWISTVAD